MYDLTIIGGGFYGSMLAIHEAKKGKSVCLIEQEKDLMLRASFGNQAIIHRGYHYPRSIKTGLSSSKNYKRFMKDFADCVYSKHKKYHAISKSASHVSAKEYEKFCQTIGSPCKQTSKIQGTNLSNVYLTPETSFNADKLRERIRLKLKLHKVNVKLNTEVISFNNNVITSLTTTQENSCINKTHTKHVAICTYANTNSILEEFGLPKVNLKFQIAEMILVDVPKKYKNVGITVMDGPFFSLTPFPARDCHVISHVQHSVHAQWTSEMNLTKIESISTNFKYMQEAVQRIFPDLTLTYKESIFETKALLPISCHDDGRPILITHPKPNITVVLGSKIDNVYDMLDYMDDNGVEGRNIHAGSSK